MVYYIAQTILTASFYPSSNPTANDSGYFAAEMAPITLKSKKGLRRVFS